MKNSIEFLANRPWILIFFGFFLLVSVWVFFFTLAIRNQPEHLPIGMAPVSAESPETITAEIGRG